MFSARKAHWLATASIAALAGVSSANAADIAVRRAAPVVSTWAGPYIGVHGGVVRQEATTNDLDGYGTANSTFQQTQFVDSGTGGLAGVHAGYNWQTSDLIYGVEADVAGIFGSDSHLTVLDPNGNSNVAERFSSELKWLTTFRARLGWGANGTMMYVTGGLAVGGVRNRWGYTDTFPALVYQFADDETRVGWTAGGGFEHRFTPNWSARIEGLYVDLGRSKTVAVTGAPGSGGTNFGTYRSRWENTAIVARAGLTYHWGP